MRNFKSSLLLLGIYVLMILFLEIVFKARLLYFDFSMSSFLSLDLLRNVLFTLSYGLFIILFLKLFNPRTVKYLCGFFTVALVGLYFSQDIFYLIASNFYSFNLSGELAAGLTFFYRLPQSLTWSHIFYLFPIVFMVFLVRHVSNNDLNLFKIRYNSLVQPMVFIFLAISFFFVSVQTIDTFRDEDDEYAYSDYDLYIEPIVPHTAMRKFGVITYARIDIKNAVRPQDNMVLGDDDIETFFDQRPRHEVNDKTGIFEDKNLILIMAESLDTYAIHPIFTPNLYALMEDNWHFDNFYAPLYYRNTADTDFMVQTGYYPNKNIQLSMHTYLNNEFPDTFPKLFGELGYTSNAFHNFSDHFYPRAEFFPKTLGYDAYFGPDELAMLIPPDEERTATGHYWHSDLELFEKGLPHILSDDQFFSYFLTVTGHLPYEDGRHDYAQKHYETIQTLIDLEGYEDIPESIKHYHAAHWEFDLAIGYLMDELERTDRLDDTVIVIFGDHYAYGLDRETIWDYDDTKNEENVLDIHRVPLIIASTDIEGQTFDNLMSTIDLLPTLSNMFNLDLTYEHMMGNDAFNSHANTVIFSSSSFLTPIHHYNIEQDVFIGTDETITDEEIRSYIGNILYRNRINNYILNYNYFGDEPVSSSMFNDPLTGYDPDEFK